MHPEPATLDSQLHARAVFGRRAALLLQERPIDLLDMDAAVLHRLGGVSDLDQLARRSVGIIEPVRLDEFHGALREMGSSVNQALLGRKYGASGDSFSGRIISEYVR